MPRATDGPSSWLWRELEQMLSPDDYAQLRAGYLARMQARMQARRGPKRAVGMCVDCNERPIVRSRRCAVCAARHRGRGR